MKRILALSSSIAAAAIVATAGSAMHSSATHSKPRSGPLHVTKECSEYDGSAGSFCTITSSNIRAIKPGMRVVYLKPLRDLVLDTDVVLSFRPRRAAFGHVVLNLATSEGRVTFSGGTGKFRRFRADAVVSQDAIDKNVWYWDGTYSFTRRNHDD
jgi:hypothetical protein